MAVKKTITNRFLIKLGNESTTGGFSSDHDVENFHTSYPKETDAESHGHIAGINTDIMKGKFSSAIHLLLFSVSLSFRSTSKQTCQ